MVSEHNFEAFRYINVGAKTKTSNIVSQNQETNWGGGGATHLYLPLTLES